MSLYYQPYSETQPLDPTLGKKSTDGGNSNVRFAKNTGRQKRRARMKKMLPVIGIVTLALVMIGAAIVVFLSSGYTFRKPLSETDPELYYSQIASKQLTENLNSKTTGKKVKPGCEATVMVMRHCERYFARTDKAKNEYCGYLGLERAHYLATLFGDVSSDQSVRWPAPYKIYAMSPSRPNTDIRNYRQADTMQPLADKLELMVNTDFTSGEEDRLARTIFKDLRKGKLCGELVLVSWSHEIPPLAQQLGCGPYNGCSLESTEFMYDSAWQIKLVYNTPKAGAGPEEDEADVDNNDDSVNATNNDDDGLPLLGGTKSFFRHRNTKVEAWEVHGAVVHMNFDPLSFSAKVGDYPEGGKATGGNWRSGDLL